MSTHSPNSENTQLVDKRKWRYSFSQVAPLGMWWNYKYRFSSRSECFCQRLSEPQILLISLNSSEMHRRPPAASQSSVPLVFNKDREINTIPCFDALRRKRIPLSLLVDTTKQQGSWGHSFTFLMISPWTRQRVREISIHFHTLFIACWTLLPFLFPPSSRFPLRILTYVRLIWEPALRLKKKNRKLY